MFVQMVYKYAKRLCIHMYRHAMHTYLHAQRHSSALELPHPHTPSLD